jgi:single-stranded DNA-specific DHH superfamily exonuclease
VDKNKEEIEWLRKTGVADRWENIGIDFVIFNPQEVIKYIFLSEKKWSPGSLACIYHTLVNKFGRQLCDNIFSKLKSKEK